MCSLKGIFKGVRDGDLSDKHSSVRMNFALAKSLDSF